MNEKDIKIDPVAKARLDAYMAKNPLKDFFTKRNAKEAELKEKFGDDFGKDDGYPFRLNKAEAGTIAEWLESLKPEILAIQKANGSSSLVGGEPYYGAVGGGVTYSFIPTGVGNILIVKESTTGKELNVTQALDWFFFG